jgi:hypothetical protein
MLQIIFPQSFILASICIFLSPLTVLQSFYEVALIYTPVLVGNFSRAGFITSHRYSPFIYSSTLFNFFEDYDSWIPNSWPLMRDVSLFYTTIEIYLAQVNNYRLLASSC